MTHDNDKKSKRTTTMVIAGGGLLMIAVVMGACGNLLGISSEPDPPPPAPTTDGGSPPTSSEGGGTSPSDEGGVVINEPVNPPDCLGSPGRTCKDPTGTPSVCYVDGSCLPLLADGESCTAYWQCTSGKCQREKDGAITGACLNANIVPTCAALEQKGCASGNCCLGASCSGPIQHLGCHQCAIAEMSCKQTADCCDDLQCVNDRCTPL